MPKSRLMVGGGVDYGAEYVGGSKKRASPVLFVDYQHESGFFASFLRGIGMQKEMGDVTLSGALIYDFGRIDSRSGSSPRPGSDDLRGMGEIPGSAQAQLGVSVDLGVVNANFAANLPLSQRQTGRSYSMGLSGHILQSQSDQIEWEVAGLWGDRAHVQSHFGVTERQSIDSGYRSYSPNASFEQVSTKVAWVHVIDKQWSVRTAVGLLRVVGQAADSPLIKSKSTPTLTSTLNYVF
ncbi:MAG: MipA/OmpV family protein [Pseudomonadota bacterium]